MSTSKLPDWYPLPVYSRTLKDEEWAAEVFVRMAVRARCSTESQDYVPEWSYLPGEDIPPKEYFEMYIVNDESPVEALFKDDEKIHWAISGMTDFELEFLAQVHRPQMAPEVKLWAERLSTSPETWLRSYRLSDVHDRVMAASKSVTGDDRAIELHRDVLGHRIPLMVDINMDDETLKFWFEFHLKLVREASGPTKRPFSDKDFANWRKYGLLQAFDLATWSSITAAGFTDVFIAQTIWPDANASLDGADRTERYRKTTKPLVEKVFSPWEALRLLRQVEMVRRLQKILEKRKEGLRSGHLSGPAEVE